VWSQGGLARPYADFPSEEDTPFPLSRSSSPEPLWGLRRYRCTVAGLAHPVLSQKPRKQA